MAFADVSLLARISQSIFSKAAHQFIDALLFRTEPTIANKPTLNLTMFCVKTPCI